MALTSWTPTGALSKITQFTIGAVDRSNPATNLMTGGMTSEIASNAANLLSDIKPGYMLGAKPRQQAIGHVIGIFAGALASTPLFFLLFLPPGPDGVRTTASIVSDQFPMPAALQWKGVSDLISAGLKNLPASVIVSMAMWPRPVRGASKSPASSRKEDSRSRPSESDLASCCRRMPRW